MFVLRLLGNPAITGEDGAPLTGTATQRHRVALLALLAIAGGRGLSREKLLGYLWPNRDAESARLLLNQAVYNLRKALGDDALLSAADDLRLNSERVEVDAVQFEAALERGDHDAAFALYRGPFLDGFFVSDAVEFERWTDRERARLADRYADTLEALADAAEASSDTDRAVRWWKARAALDPHDSRVAVRLMRALAASGNHAGALQHADIHARLLEDEFGTQPPPQVLALAERLRNEPGPRSQSPLDRVSPALSPARAAAPVVLRRRSRIRYAVAALVVGAVLFTTLWATRSRGGPSSTNESRRSIAVLPLANQSVDPRDSAFADGMTDELIAILAKNSGLRVIGSTSVFAYRNRQGDVRGIADSLGVANVLEGGLQKDGNRLRVRVRLLDARDGSTRWSETYDGELRDVFTVQGEIAQAVARELGVRLGVTSTAAPRRQPTQNIAAYELYLRGSDRTLLRSDSAARQGVEYFRQAIALDSGYAAAWAGLARLNTRLAGFAPRADRARLYALAEEAARKAVALDDSLAEAHATLGAIRMALFDFGSAERHMARAIALDSSRALTYQWMVTIDFWMGRPAEALAHARRAVALDPLSPDAHADLARALLGNDRCDEALAELAPLSSLRPPLLRVAPIAAECYARMGMWPQAIATIRPQAERGDPMALAQLAYVLARGGQRDSALRIQATLLERWRRGESGAFENALVATGLGNLDQAFDWMNRAIDDHSFSGVPGSPALLLLVGPLFPDMQHDPRFAAIRARLGIQKR